jgi:hypothetical protein
MGGGNVKLPRLVKVTAVIIAAMLHYGISIASAF